MNQQFNFNQSGLQMLSAEDLISINGGDVIDRNSAAYKWGQEVRKALDNVVLALFFWA